MSKIENEVVKLCLTCKKENCSDRTMTKLPQCGVSTCWKHEPITKEDQAYNQRRSGLS